MKPCLSNYVVTLQVSCEYDYECIVGGQVLYDKVRFVLLRRGLRMV